MNLEQSHPNGHKQVIPIWNHRALELKPEQGTNGHHSTRRLAIAFGRRANEPLPYENSPECQSPQLYEFEGLLVEILARFVNLPTGEVDREIENALQRVCSFLQLERGQLWSRSGQAGDSFKLTHQCLPTKADTASTGANGANGAETLRRVHAVPLGTESRECLPWMTAQALRGRTIHFSQIAELPEEAEKDRQALAQNGTRSGVAIPFLVNGDVFGVLSFDMLQWERAWQEPLIKRLQLVAEVFANATARKLADHALRASIKEVVEMATERKNAEDALAKSYEEIKQLKDRLQVESDYLKAEMKVNQLHGEIIGRSSGIKRVLHQVEQVAPADCAVLISGETGTGKELIAQEIHRLSARKERVMVLVNCAALPSALVESELFGRERGAYTGALTSQVGRFEVANGSTIFLDEVGELSMEVQAKLLRVLQQGEFQRLGSPKNHKVDVRVIAATNRDLDEEVRKGRFREDLYYRLKVFPIDVPPLRERAEDIPLLVFAFMEEFSKRMGKKITKLPRKSMEILQAHAWQGNIRELRNVIEHSVILSSTDTLKLTALGDAPVREAKPVTLAEAEREHILKTLESTGWRIKGPHGAAVRLDLQPSTLYSRMQKLGIPHRRQKDEMGL